MEYKSVNKNIKKLWYIRRTIPTILLLILWIVFLQVFISTRDSNYTISTKVFMIWTIICLLFFILMILVSYVLPSFQYKEYQYKIENDELWFKKGVIFKSEIVIPFCQIQDLSILQGPFETLFKIKSLNVSTAGSSICISGLIEEEAKNIKMVLKENVKIYVNKRLEGDLNEEIS